MKKTIEDINASTSSTIKQISYSLGSFLNDFLATALGVWVFKFYETEVFLPIIFISIATVIYGFVNMLNDPWAGHISDKPTRLSRRWGKQFSWFVITALPSTLLCSLIYMPPLNADYIFIFFWVLVCLCVFDTLLSFAIINWQAIFPDKFRSQRERTKVGGIQILCSIIGLSVGYVLPMLIITSGPPGTNINSFILSAVFISIISLIVVLLMIPGMREDEEMIARTLKTDGKLKESHQYIKKIKFALKQKNFIAYLFAYLAQNVVMVLFLASIPYWTDYIMRADFIIEIYVFASFLSASLISVPLWIYIARKYGNRIGYICGTGLSSLSLTIALFQTELMGVLICIFFVGFSMGATWCLIYPTFSDIIDEIVVKTGERNDGIYYGFRTFFGRLSIIVEALTFGILHTITFFDPQSSTQTPLAQWGIKLGMFFVPALFYFIGFLFMWRVSDLKPLKVNKIKIELKELNL